MIPITTTPEPGKNVQVRERDRAPFSYGRHSGLQIARVIIGVKDAGEREKQNSNSSLPS
jgi:hypothetical protein